MKVNSLAIAMVASLPASAAASHTSMKTSMSPREVEAFSLVADKCARDVELVCPRSDERAERKTSVVGSDGPNDRIPFPFSPMFGPLFFPPPPAHPMMRGGLLPMPPPPPQSHEMSMMLDQMMNDFFRMSGPRVDSFVLVFDDSPSFMNRRRDKEAVPCDQAPSESVEQTSEEAAADEAANHIVSHLAANTPVEHLEHVANHVAEHGRSILNNEVTTFDQNDSAAALQRRRLHVARRLTEVSAEVLREQRQKVLLPFGGNAQNSCFYTAFVDRRITDPQCQRAMEHLQMVRSVQAFEEEQSAAELKSIWMQLSIMYGLVVAIMIVMYFRHNRKAAKDKQRLRMRLLRAMYSKPALKKSMEQELGQSVGHVPPYTWHESMTFGGFTQPYLSWVKTAGRIRVVFLVLMIAYLFLDPAPVFIMPVFIAYMVYLFFIALCAPKPVACCTCCACGLTTQDVEAGNVTEEQACCGCCQGTGVCSVNCVSCHKSDDDKEKKSSHGCFGICSPEEEEVAACCCCACCGTPESALLQGCCGDCCCCNMRAKTGDANMACCCCGDSGCCDKQKKDKTDVKMTCCCCDCCSMATTSVGTCGSCCCCENRVKAGSDAGCCCCCDKATKQRRVIPAQHAVYEGIPMQIV